MAEYFDTHCHIHTSGSLRDDFTVQKWHKAGEDNPKSLLSSAVNNGITGLICVGTDTDDSVEALNFVKNHPNTWAAVGVHPHEAKKTTSDNLRQIRNLIESDQRLEKPSRKIVAIGEVGLDYYYEHSPRLPQAELLEQFLDMAEKYNLPVIFHVREAFSDFWPIIANFKIRGVLHSFSADTATLEKALARDLFIGLNGIMTFTKDETQLKMAKQVPLVKLLLETDAPYLTPVTFRGKVCKPEHVRETAKFLATLRGEQIEDLASQTTQNARQLFEI